MSHSAVGLAQAVEKHNSRFVNISLENTAIAEFIIKMPDISAKQVTFYFYTWLLIKLLGTIGVKQNKFMPHNLTICQIELLRISIIPRYYANVIVLSKLYIHYNTSFLFLQAYITKIIHQLLQFSFAFFVCFD